MTRPIETMEEFLQLAYSPPSIPGKSGLRDIYLADYTFARLVNGRLEIQFMTNGMNITIDKGWLDLFHSLNTWGGHRILNYPISQETDSRDDRLIFEMMKLLNVYLYQSGRGDEFLRSLAEVCHLGTQSFRGWLKENYGISLEPIIYNSLEKYIKV